MADLIGHRIDDYEIVSLLGTGGMAEVYFAHQHLASHLQRDVALKLMITELSDHPEFVRRFEHEAEMQMSLSHPHILKAFDYGQHGDKVYLITEYLNGGTLVDRIRQGPLSLEQIRKWLEQIAHALDYAHGRNIIHCDLKPQNVLLDTGDNAFLSDFGISHLISDIANASGDEERSVVGTPAYMSPEQWLGDRLDLRTDLYALGVMLFEMLTGRVPFVGDGAYQVMRQHQYNPPPSAHLLRPGLPAAIDHILARALAKLPEDRYPSAVAIFEDYSAIIRRIDRTTVISADPLSAAVPSDKPRVSTQRIQFPANYNSDPTPIPIDVNKLNSATERLHPPISRPNVQHVRPLAQYNRDGVSQLLWSPGSLHLAVVGEKQIWLHDVETLDAAPRIIEHPTRITSAAFSPNDALLAFGGEDSAIHFWNTASGAHLNDLSGHSAAVTGLSFSVDGKLLASGSADGTIRLWDVNNHTCVAVLGEHTERLSEIAFSPTGTMLVSTSANGVMQVWAVQP